jgi:hypothetical protein
MFLEFLASKTSMIQTTDIMSSYINYGMINDDSD